MNSCRSCGGDNPPGVVRCQYCDKTLAELKAVEVEWSARDRGGATGRGRVQAQVPVTSGPEALRGLIDAAFAGALGDVGADLRPAAVRDAMQRRLAALLPRDHALVGVEVEAVERFVLVAGPAEGRGPATATAAAAAAAPGRKGPALASVFCLVAAGSCCLMTGVGGLAAGSDWGAARAAVERAQVLAPADAAKASGLVCVEGAVAEVASPLRIPGGEVPYLVLVETEARTEPVTTTRTRTVNGRTETVEERTTRTVTGAPRRDVVARFGLGPLVVLTDGATFDGDDEAVTASRSAGGSTFTYKGLRADRPLTVVGQAQGGQLGKGGEAFLISTQPTRAALVARLGSLAGASRGVGAAALIGGAVLLLAGGVAAVRR